MVARVFVQFLILGCIAFGGPIAHLAFFERAFVERLKWMSHAQLASLIALCQALPGPASSQTAMGIGYFKAGWGGLFAAWTGFTLPPALLMLGAAYGAVALSGTVRTALTHGMKVAVVGVIAVALWRMSRSLLKTRRRVLAVGAYALLFYLFPSPWVILLLIILVVLISLRMEQVPLGKRDLAHLGTGAAKWLLAALPVVFLLLVLLHSAFPGPWTAIADAFYQTGLLVFGGGHVVLPLLDNFVVAPGWVSRESFLFGYGVAQMIPGPLFSFSVFLGAQFPVDENLRFAAGLIALAAIYLPSFFLLGILLPRWHEQDPSSHWKRVLDNLHPLVIGLLLATWINPVILSAIRSWPDLVVAAVVSAALLRFQRWTVIIMAVTGGLYWFVLS